MPPWLAFERRIFVKQNAADVLRRTLRHGSERALALLEGETIVIGTATDPFQPAERRFRITRSVLEVLADHPGLSVCIITKSPLITRDIDVLHAHQARISSLSVHLSLISPTAISRADSSRALPRPTRALRALARLRASGDRDGDQRDAGAAGDHRSPGGARATGAGRRRATVRRTSTRARCGCDRRRARAICRSSRRSFRISPSAIARRTRTITR